MDENVKPQGTPKLFAALAKAQAEFQVAEKNGHNTYLGNWFSTLEDLLAASRPALGKHGLSVIQICRVAGGNVQVTTKLCHESGESLDVGDIAVKTKDEAQAVGSALTYVERYGYRGPLVVASKEDEDDGEAAQPKPAAAPRQDAKAAVAEKAAAARNVNSFAEKVGGTVAKANGKEPIFPPNWKMDSAGMPLSQVTSLGDLRFWADKQDPKHPQYGKRNAELLEKIEARIAAIEEHATGETDDEEHTEEASPF